MISSYRVILLVERRPDNHRFRIETMSSIMHGHRRYQGRDMPFIIAHGALGPFDEIIFLGIAIVFLGMMGMSWLRSQQLEGDEPADGETSMREAERYELD